MWVKIMLKEGLREAIDYFKKAMRLDPSYQDKADDNCYCQRNCYVHELQPRLQAASAFEILGTPVTEPFTWKPFSIWGAPLAACF
jgi:hypothetical protein